MAQVILFHSILGLRPGVLELARRLTAAGHPTVTPDLYDGRSTADVDAGFALFADIGKPTLLARAADALMPLPAATVLAGISMGAGITGDMWANRPAAAAVMFLSGPGPIPAPRPSRAPVAMHMARPDPFDDEAFVAEWAGDPAAQPLDIYRYDGVGHNFLDLSGPDWDAQAADLCINRLIGMLDAVGT